MTQRRWLTLIGWFSPSMIDSWARLDFYRAQRYFSAI